MGERLSQELRAAIRQRIEAATPGPWLSSNGDLFQGAELPDGSVLLRGINHYEGDQYSQLTDADAAFIAAARTDVPLLLEALEEAEREVERLRSQIEADDEAALDRYKEDMAQEASNEDS